MDDRRGTTKRGLLYLRAVFAVSILPVVYCSLFRGNSQRHASHYAMPSKASMTTRAFLDPQPARSLSGVKPDTSQINYPGFGFLGGWTSDIGRSLGL